MSVLRVHRLSPGDRIATLTMSLCTSIPATRSYCTFTRGHLLQRQPPTGWEQARRPPEPRPVQETDTRARSSNGGYPGKGLRRQSRSRPRTVQALTTTTRGTSPQLCTFRPPRRPRDHRKDPTPPPPAPARPPTAPQLSSPTAPPRPGP